MQGKKNIVFIFSVCYTIQTNEIRFGINMQSLKENLTMRKTEQ